MDEGLGGDTAADAAQLSRREEELERMADALHLHTPELTWANATSGRRISSREGVRIDSPSALSGHVAPQ